MKPFAEQKTAAEADFPTYRGNSLRHIKSALLCLFLLAIPYIFVFNGCGSPSDADLYGKTSSDSVPGSRSGNQDTDSPLQDTEDKRSGSASSNPASTSADGPASAGAGNPASAGADNPVSDGTGNPALAGADNSASAGPGNPSLAGPDNPVSDGPNNTDSDITIVMVGDVLLHTPVAESGLRADGNYCFDALFTHVGSVIQQADLALVNQEVIIGGSELGVSGYPCFNAPYELGDALVSAGFDVVLHATNHALDKGEAGIQNCLAYWAEHPEIAVLGICADTDNPAGPTGRTTAAADATSTEASAADIPGRTTATTDTGITTTSALTDILDHTSAVETAITDASAADIPNGNGDSAHTAAGNLGHNGTTNQNRLFLCEQNGIRIAVLNYTYGTNGIPIPADMPDAVSLLEEETVLSDLAMAEELADFTIVCPHWGTEYQLVPSSEQKYWADLFLENGADLCIGTHPHVIEPIEWMRDDKGHEMLVYYSLGNFVNWTSSSGDGIANRMVGGMATVTISRTTSGEVRITDYGVLPLVCHLSDGTDGVTTWFLSDYTEELAAENAIIAQDPAFSREYCVRLCNEVWGDLCLSE